MKNPFMIVVEKKGNQITITKVMMKEEPTLTPEQAKAKLLEYGQKVRDTKTRDGFRNLLLEYNDFLISNKEAIHNDKVNMAIINAIHNDIMSKTMGFVLGI